MTGAALSRLEQLDLRHIRTSEAGDFAPWLSQEENLSLLADTIGIELEFEAQEKNVGRLWAGLIAEQTLGRAGCGGSLRVSPRVTFFEREGELQ